MLLNLLLKVVCNFVLDKDASVSENGILQSNWYITTILIVLKVIEG